MEAHALTAAASKLGARLSWDSLTVTGYLERDGHYVSLKIVLKSPFYGFQPYGESGRLREYGILGKIYIQSAFSVQSLANAGSCREGWNASGISRPQKEFFYYNPRAVFQSCRSWKDRPGFPRQR